VGEIQVRGPSQLLGYAREGRLQGAGLTDDGFFATGDLASLRPDGRLRITGRKKDVIMRGWKGIDPAEVELALARHPAVVEVCVVGVRDPIMGERVAAAIVTSDDSVDADALCGYLDSEGVPKHKWPEHVVPFAGDLPRTGTRKVARARVKEIVEARVAEAAGVAAAPQEAARG
jgi:cyclohexanecarboxylate-CoA ligase